MTHEQREIHREKRVIEYAESIGNVRKACRYFGIAFDQLYRAPPEPRRVALGAISSPFSIMAAEPGFLPP